MKRIIVLAAGGLLLAAPPILADGPGEVTAVSVVPGAGRAHVLIDVLGDVTYEDFTLANPARVVIDVTGATLATAGARWPTVRPWTNRDLDGRLVEVIDESSIAVDERAMPFQAVEYSLELHPVAVLFDGLVGTSILAGEWRDASSCRVSSRVPGVDQLGLARGTAETASFEQSPASFPVAQALSRRWEPVGSMARSGEANR